MTSPRTPVQILAVKAFGDFVIALGAVERAADGAWPQHSILAADHLKPLAAALKPQCEVAFLENVEATVPALFDFKRAGVYRALQSAIALRRAVSEQYDPYKKLLIDKRGWRENWLSSISRDVVALPDTANIYAAYRTVLGDGAVGERSERPKGSQTVVGIFPGSRMKAKDLPATLIHETIAAVVQHGYRAQLFLLDGERPDLEASGIDHQKLPRQFAALAAAVDEVALVVGADSLPVHLAERSRRPVFVLSPTDNSYWLPQSSFLVGHWAQFDAIDRMAKLSDFLRNA